MLRAWSTMVAQRSDRSGPSPGGGLLREACPGGKSDRASAVRGEGGTGVRGGTEVRSGTGVRGGTDVRGGKLVRDDGGIDRECTLITSTCFVTRSRYMSSRASCSGRPLVR